MTLRVGALAQKSDTVPELDGFLGTCPEGSAFKVTLGCTLPVR